MFHPVCRSLENQTEWAIDKLVCFFCFCAHFYLKQLVNFGSEILKLVPGRVSTEVDAR